MILLSLFLACQEQTPAQVETSPSQSSPQSRDIDVEEFYTRVQKGVPLIIDVRTPQEYAQGHIPKAKNIPLSTLEQQLPSLQPNIDQEIYLVCAVGGRSAKATDMMRAKGFQKAINVQGGTRGWKAKGYPTE